MVESIVRLLATLHGAGFIHRDLKPGAHSWTYCRISAGKCCSKPAHT